MNDLRKAAEMALERLESHDYWADEEAIQALRQALYCTPEVTGEVTGEVKHEWVGLTDEERKQIVYTYMRDPFDCLHMLEAKLKEKNHR